MFDLCVPGVTRTRMRRNSSTRTINTGDWGTVGHDAAETIEHQTSGPARAAQATRAHRRKTAQLDATP